MLYEDARLIAEGPKTAWEIMENMGSRAATKYIEAARRLAEYHLSTRCQRDWGDGNHCGRDSGHEGSCAVFVKDEAE